MPIETIHIGLISDTHGLMRPQAVKALRGSDLIIHGGDVGQPEILDTLESIAPVHTVRGNVDYEPWTQRLPNTKVVEAGDVLIYVLHNLYELNIDPDISGFRMVVYGHSHQPSIEEKRSVIYLNPGSAGPNRFSLPVSVARVTVTGNEIEAKIMELDV
ncbi:MAG: metallophosphoesterase family protein [Gemmatimonadota bacterium]|nr:metallophosphoesterase family protein [Gemmatimonadota bacterium]